MPRGAGHSRKPTQSQRTRMRRRGKKNTYDDYCGCCPPDKHPELDWCMRCQKRIRLVTLAKDKIKYAP